MVLPPTPVPTHLVSSAVFLCGVPLCGHWGRQSTTEKLIRTLSTAQNKGDFKRVALGRQPCG